MSRKTIESILEARKQSPFDSLSNFLMRTEAEFQEVENLVKCGVMDCFPQSRPELLWMLELSFDKIQRLKRNGKRETGLFSLNKLLDVPDISSHISDYSPEEKLRLEKHILGMTVSHHPLESYRKKLERIELIECKDLFRYRGKRVKLAGWLVATKRCSTSKGEFMKFVTLEDMSGVYDAVFFPRVYQQYGHLIVSRGPFIIEGKVDEDCGHCTITAEKIEAIAHEENITA